MITLFTMLSMMGGGGGGAGGASSCFPALCASVALRMALRRREVKASFRARCTSDCRAAFSADFVFAKRRLLEAMRVALRPQKRRTFSGSGGALSMHPVVAGPPGMAHFGPGRPRRDAYNDGLS